MISICEKVRLQQLKKAKYWILASISHIFHKNFLTEPHIYLYNTLLCKSLWFSYILFWIWTHFLKNVAFLKNELVILFWTRSNVVFSFENGLNCQNHSSSGFHHLIKVSPNKISHSPRQEIPPNPEPYLEKPAYFMRTLLYCLPHLFPVFC